MNTIEETRSVKEVISAWTQVLILILKEVIPAWTQVLILILKEVIPAWTQVLILILKEVIPAWTQVLILILTLTLIQRTLEAYDRQDGYMVGGGL